MANPHGTPIWYELMTADPDGSIAFYEAVIGWKVGDKPAGELDYRQIDTDNGAVGGMLTLSPQMLANGAKPLWIVYLGVDDVDATVAKISQRGGAIHIPPKDLEGVGRMAMIADPQGIPCYVMRGFSDEDSTVWQRDGMGKCNWHELATPDQQAANAFYAEIFGWSYPDKMAMPGDAGDYVFVETGGETIGATMPAGADQPAGWTFYFRAPDIEVAAARVKELGGTVHAGPMEVPGGDRIIVASDPQGARFGVAAPG